MTQHAQHKPYRVQSGIAVLVANIALLAIGLAFLFVSDFPPLGLFITLVSVVLPKGFFIVSAERGKALFLLGRYQGAVTQAGFYWVHPLLKKQSFLLGKQYLALAGEECSDLGGMALRIHASIGWQVAKPDALFTQPVQLQEEMRHQSISAIAHIVASLPYFPQTNHNTGKKVGIKGQKEALERLVWSNLQKRLEPLGLQVAEVSLLQIAPPTAIAELQQQELIRQQSDKSWAMQTVPLALRILAQYEASNQLIGASEEAKRQFLENVILTLNKK